MTGRRWCVGVLVIVLGVVGGLGGCSRPTEVVLPPGLVCGALDPTKLAPLLPPGSYQTSGSIKYDNEVVLTWGGCDLYLTSGGDSSLQVALSADTDYGLVDTGYHECVDPFPIKLTLPPVGSLVGSGSCRHPDPTANLYLTNRAWVEYWGGELVAGGARGTIVIDVTIRPVKDHDNLVDAAQIVQLVLDFISQSYASDPPGVPPVSATSVVPSDSPS